VRSVELIAALRRLVESRTDPGFSTAAPGAMGPEPETVHAGANGDATESARITRQCPATLKWAPQYLRRWPDAMARGRTKKAAEQATRVMSALAQSPPTGGSLG